MCGGGTQKVIGSRSAISRRLRRWVHQNFHGYFCAISPLIVLDWLTSRGWQWICIIEIFRSALVIFLVHFQKKLYQTVPCHCCVTFKGTPFVHLVFHNVSPGKVTVVVPKVQLCTLNDFLKVLIIHITMLKIHTKDVALKIPTLWQWKVQFSTFFFF